MTDKLQDHARKLIACLRPPKVLRAKPELLQHENLLCMPLSSLDTQKLRLQGGLYSGKNGYIPSSGLITNQQVIVGDGPIPPPSSAPMLTGNSLYLGVCHYHFGHFLIETLSRLWFLNPEEIKKFDHIVLLPLNGTVPEFALDLFKLLEADHLLRVITEPVFLENVCIPSPAIEYPRQVHQAIDNIQRLFAPSFAAEPTEQAVFLSRSRLVPGHHRMIIGEDWLERALHGQGVLIFHPQDHAIHEQISILRRHRTVIGFAGSALHTLILARGGKKVLAYSARKTPAVFPLLDKALHNRGVYVRAGRDSLAGLASLAVGFKPQFIDPRLVLRELKRQKVIKDNRLEGYGTAASEAREVSRYNTALLLRWVLEASQTQAESDCRARIRAFADNHELDADMLAQARQGSALMRHFFPA